MMLWWIVAMLVVVLLMFWLVSPIGAKPEAADEILKRRYARGEIDREEYQRRLEDLRR